MHAKTSGHTHTQSYTQTGHFPGAFHSNIHQWEKRGIIMVWTDTDYWLRGAESPTCDGGNSWIQRREGLMGNLLLVAEQWDDYRAETELLTSPLACHLRAYPSPLNTTMARLFPPYIQKHSNCLSAETERNSFPGPWKAEKTTSQKWQYLSHACKQTYAGCGRRATL